MEGPRFGGAYARREICVTKSVGLDCSRKEIYHFCFVLLCIRGQIPSTSPRGAYIRRSNLTEGFLRYDFGGLIFGGAYTWRGCICSSIGMCRLCDTQNVAHPQDALGPSYFQCQRSFVPWYKVESSLLVC